MILTALKIFSNLNWPPQSSIPNLPLVTAMMLPQCLLLWHNSSRAHFNPLMIFFEDTTPLQRDNQALHPLCTFANSHTAFHFNHHLSFKQMMVEEAAEKFCLSDLHPALVDFVSCYALENPASFTLIAISLIKVSQATHQCNAPNLSHLKCLKLPQTNANTVKHLKNFSTKIWVFLMTMQ